MAQFLRKRGEVCTGWSLYPSSKVGRGVQPVKRCAPCAHLKRDKEHKSPIQSQVMLEITSSFLQALFQRVNILALWGLGSAIFVVLEQYFLFVFKIYNFIHLCCFRPLFNFVIQQHETELTMCLTGDSTILFVCYHSLFRYASIKETKTPLPFVCSANGTYAFSSWERNNTQRFTICLLSWCQTV